MLRQIVALLGTVTIVAAVFFAVTRGVQPTRRQTATWSNLAQTYIALNPRVPLRLSPLVTSQGAPFAPAQLLGRWSVVFFGFTNCPLVCPKTLGILNAAANIPATGFAAQHAQVLFVSIDPERDTPARVAAYLAHFDSSFIGLTGTRDATSQFAGQLGAGFKTTGKTIDHSSSLFVVDPEGRLAGMLLRPNDPAAVLADFNRIRQSAGAQISVGSR